MHCRHTGKLNVSFSPLSSRSSSSNVHNKPDAVEPRLSDHKMQTTIPMTSLRGDGHCVALSSSFHYSLRRGPAWGIEQTSLNCVLRWGPTNLWLITILLYPGRFLACLAILVRLVVCSTNAHEQYSKTHYANIIRHYQKWRLRMSSLRSKRPSAKRKLSGYLTTCGGKAKSTRLSLPNKGF